MKSLTFDNKLKLYWFILHVISIVGLFRYFDFVGLLISYILYLLIKGVGSEIGAHRYFTHKSFETTKFKEKVLIFLQTFAGEGSMISFVGLHRLHHSFSDTERDPHSPIFSPWYRVFYLLNPPHIPVNIVKDCFRNPYIKFQHTYYFHIHAILLLLLFISPWLYLYLVALPILLSVYTNGFINYFLHGRTNGVASAINSKYLNIFLFGAGYHLNHHLYPKNYRYNENPLKDPIGEIIHRVFKS